MKTTVVGNYPKISSDKNAANLRNSLNTWDQKKITAEQLEKVYEETIKRVLKEQTAAGIDVITDGQIRWDDLVTPLAKNITGFEIGGLIRFYNNNVYYRRPVVKSRLSFKNYSAVEQFKFAQANSSKPVKVALPGPFTFAQLSLDEYYGNVEKLTMDLAEILHQEVRGLEQAGCQHIQLDEPSLCFNPDKVDLAIRAINSVFERVSTKKIVFLYFGKVGQVLPNLLGSSVDSIGVDVVSHPDNLDTVIDTWQGKEVILGCLDARNTKLEREEGIRQMVEKASKRVPLQKISLSPSCGLEFLPHETALQKLKLLADFARKLN
ncbi:MAG: hypothetical protein A2Z27_05895 [candidate division Zixibacteria bacterium RBG_16_50_21]|nr:MAG: hypothetical protein A2Z27_05895 [candidate division Zixibacteria bacterium RBG_16_50_21]